MSTCSVVSVDASFTNKGIAMLLSPSYPIQTDNVRPRDDRSGAEFDNLSRYVANDPVNQTDPSGMDPTTTIVHATLPEYAASIVTNGLKTGKDGVIWLASVEAAGTGASAKATVHVTIEAELGAVKEIPASVISDAQKYANKTLSGSGLTGAERNAAFGRYKGDYIAKWVLGQSEGGVYSMPNPQGRPGIHYAIKPDAWAKSAPRITSIAGEGADEAIAILARESAAVGDAAEAAAAKWGSRLKFAGKIGGGVLIAVGAGVSLYNIFSADRMARQTAIEVGGFAGGWAGFKAGFWLGGGGALVGGQLGPQAAAPEEIVTVPASAIIVGLGMAGCGAYFGQTVTRTVYDWVFPPGFPIPVGGK